MNIDDVRDSIIDLRMTLTQAKVGNGVKPPLLGNIGVAVFEQDPPLNGALWASSKSIKSPFSNLLKTTRPNGVYIRILGGDLGIFYEIIKNGIAQKPIPIIETLNSSNHCSEHDSEFLILNATQALINNGKLQNNVHVHLFTELNPCESCCYVILQFLQNNLEAHLSVYYAFDVGTQLTAAFNEWWEMGHFQNVSSRLHFEQIDV